MKNHTKIILLSVLASVLLALLILFLLTPDLFSRLRITLPTFYSDRYDNSASYTAASEGTASGVTALEVDWVGGSVTVLPAEDGTVSFRETSSETLSNEEVMRWWNDDGTLRIHCMKSGYYASVQPQKHLTVYLPANVTYGELDLESVSADLRVSGLNFDKLEAETVSGSADLSELSGDISIESISGNLELRELNGSALNANSVSGAISGTALRFGKASGETVSGFCSLRFSALAPLREVKFDTVSGEMQLALPDAPGFVIDFDTVSGDFSSDLPSTVRQGKYTVGDGSISVKAESVSGDFSILSGK